MTRKPKPLSFVSNTDYENLRAWVAPDMAELPQVHLQVFDSTVRVFYDRKQAKQLRDWLTRAIEYMETRQR